MSCNSWTNKQTSLTDDKCQISLKDKANSQFASYSLSFPPACSINQSYLCNQSLNQQKPTLLCDNTKYYSNFRNGCFGNQLTHTKNRQNLDVRMYKTVPFMGSCRAPLMNTDTYSKLISGQSTRTSKSCNVQAKLDRFQPLVPCLANNIQNPNNHIPQYWVRGGMSTSSYYRNVDYLKECGYKNCPSQCAQMYCPDIVVPEYIKRQKMQNQNLPCMPGRIPLHNGSQY